MVRFYVEISWSLLCGLCALSFGRWARLRHATNISEARRIATHSFCVCLQEAATGWEKRQARIRAKREGARQRGWMSWGAKPAATASSYSGASSNGAGRKAEEAAAATAAAARRCVSAAYPELQPCYLFWSPMLLVFSVQLLAGTVGHRKVIDAD